VRIILKGLIQKPSRDKAETLGQHVKKQRLVLGLSQKEAAERLGVTERTVLHWEKGRIWPPVKSMPAVIRFLGYNPFQAPTTIPERLKAKRRELGWTQKTAARKLGVNPCTWSDWERDGTIMTKGHRRKVAQFLGLPEAEVYADMRRRWNDSHQRATPDNHAGQ
jgi:transcriptional regulator with XRE-family HTH domain